jgi:hypothetical protein
VRVGVDCSNACARFCGQLSSVVNQCVGTVAGYLSCISRVSVSCDYNSDNARWEIAAHLQDCQDEANALLACTAPTLRSTLTNGLDNMATPPPPGNGN